MYEYLTTFQSRFGREEWLQPYTDKTLMELPGKGVRSVQVFCPGFAADCLETLEEIAVLNRGFFLDAGGEQYRYIEALNDGAGHIEALTRLVEENLQGWLPEESATENARERQQRAMGLGAGS